MLTMTEDTLRPSVATNPPVVKALAHGSTLGFLPNSARLFNSAANKLVNPVLIPAAFNSSFNSDCNLLYFWKRNY